MNALCVALISLSLFAPGQPAQAKAKKVKINILLVEASTQSKVFDKRLEPYRKDLAPYTGAKVLDQIEKEVELGSSMSVDFKGAPGLRVTLESFDEKTTTVKLKNEIKIKGKKPTVIKTSHKKSNATFFVRPPPENPQTVKFFAVTPKL
jgi:hypothetical protein